MAGIIWQIVKYAFMHITAFKYTIHALTAILENNVPKSMKMMRGDRSIMLLREQKPQNVVIAKSHRKGKSGRAASKNGRILPVLFLYDLQMKIAYVYEHLEICAFSANILLLHSVETFEKCHICVYVYTLYKKLEIIQVLTNKYF